MKRRGTDEGGSSDRGLSEKRQHNTNCYKNLTFNNMYIYKKKFLFKVNFLFLAQHSVPLNHPLPDPTDRPTIRNEKGILLEELK